ncbi:MAG: hypothetical protein JNM84_26740 [Planctomycetes bacterium]|nr:hypothetical protein [Planctomycetota bacterium]
MRHAATLAVGFGLVALCIYTSAIRGRLWLADAALESCLREELRLEESIRNARVRRHHDASLRNLAATLRREELQGATNSSKPASVPPVALAGRGR